MQVILTANAVQIQQIVFFLFHFISNGRSRFDLKLILFKNMNFGPQWMV